MHPYHHAVSSSRKFGGEPEDYLDIHHWFDATKEHFADFRHRALRHHSQGIFECERIFGVTMVNSKGQVIPVRSIGEQHVMEDLGKIPSVKDYLKCIQVEPWMHRSPRQTGADEPTPARATNTTVVDLLSTT